jgi:uncharacterized Zn finger protein
MSRYYGGWAPYVPVAERRAKAQRKLKSLEKKGRICHPVAIEGRAITRTFWGKKWCDNLEAYSDYANRLPRGRTYVRNGSVVDLQITTGQITALVSGSEIYEISIVVRALETKRWQSILRECAGKVASLVELLQGRLSSAVMEVVTRHGTGLFPVPKQIDFRCSCPDSASMCKHIAATLYGVGTRLDSQPELLFQLCHVDPLELIRQAGSTPVTDAQTALSQHQQLDTSDLSALFGIELNEASVAISSPSSAVKSTAAAPKRPGNRERMIDSKGATSNSAQNRSEPATKKVTALRQKRTKTITASELIARGIPRHMQQSWIGSGILLRTDERGIYRTTKQTEGRIEDYLHYRRTTESK